MNAEFVDTNIHVYARDSGVGEKQRIAKDLLTRIWAAHSGATSIQVLCEFYWVVTRKIAQPLSATDAVRVVHNLGQWRVHSPTVADIERAARRAARSKLSFWDALIVESALALGCEILWTEDLHHGARYDSLHIRNPFRK